MPSDSPPFTDADAAAFTRLLASNPPARTQPNPDRVEFRRLPDEPTRVAVCEWLRRHGIDPHTVVVPGWIERQPDRCRVAWLSSVRDEAGNIVSNEARDEFLTVERYVQLEGPPLPWPAEAPQDWDRPSPTTSTPW